jgi:hypothetical protein
VFCQFYLTGHIPLTFHFGGFVVAILPPHPLSVSTFPSINFNSPERFFLSTDPIPSTGGDLFFTDALVTDGFCFERAPTDPRLPSLAH